MNDDDLRDLLRGKAEEMRLEPTAPARTVKRARRRRIGNVLLSSVLVAGIGVGSFLGAHAALQRQAVRPPNVPATLPPGPSPHPGPSLQPTLPTYTGVWYPPINSAAAGADPQAAGLAFAGQVLEWNPDRVHVEVQQASGSQAYVSLWNRDMTTTFTRQTATSLLMEKQQPTADSGPMWTVFHAESGLFDVTCPSQRQDVLVATVPPGTTGGTISVDVCGTFAQPPAGWVVEAGLRYADSNLQSSPVLSSEALSVQGQDFHGQRPLMAPSVHKDVSLEIRVYSGSGATLGLYARRFQTYDGRTSNSPGP